MGQLRYDVTLVWGSPCQAAGERTVGAIGAVISVSTSPPINPLTHTHARACVARICEVDGRRTYYRLYESDIALRGLNSRKCNQATENKP